MVKTIDRNENKFGGKEFLADTDSDKDTIELDSRRMGDTCYIIDSGSLYMANSSLQWIKQ